MAFGRAEHDWGRGSVAGGVLAEPPLLSFGLFAPRNATAILALFLCALAVAGAIEMTQELNTPFRGIIRISSKPMKDAFVQISLK
jgi:hypothetical protein